MRIAISTQPSALKLCKANLLTLAAQPRSMQGCLSPSREMLRCCFATRCRPCAATLWSSAKHRRSAPLRRHLSRTETYTVRLSCFMPARRLTLCRYFATCTSRLLRCSSCLQRLLYRSKRCCLQHVPSISICCGTAAGPPVFLLATPAQQSPCHWQP